MSTLTMTKGGIGIIGSIVPSTKMLGGVNTRPGQTLEETSPDQELAGLVREVECRVALEHRRFLQLFFAKPQPFSS